MFEINLSAVGQCVAPGHKQDELDIQFQDSESANRDDQFLYSMRLWIPGQQATEFQSSILSKAAVSSSHGEVLLEFDRDQGNFLAPKNKFSVEMYESFMRMHGNVYDFKIKYSDISKFYMLAQSRSRGQDDINFFYFVICLSKPVRQGQQNYPYLVWQTNSDEADLVLNMSEEEIQEKYPNSGLSPSLGGSLHKNMAKVFKSFTGKTVFAASRTYRSANDHQCVKCALGQRTGELYPNDKSFVFVYQPTLVIEFSEIDHVEFEKAERNFEVHLMLNFNK